MHYGVGGFWSILEKIPGVHRFGKYGLGLGKNLLGGMVPSQ